MNGHIATLPPSSSSTQYVNCHNATLPRLLVVYNMSMVIMSPTRTSSGTPYVNGHNVPYIVF